MTELIGALAGLIAIAGVVSNNRRWRGCFCLWMLSNLLSAGLHVRAGLLSLAVRDLIFFVLAIEGWLLWGKSR